MSLNDPPASPALPDAASALASPDASTSSSAESLSPLDAPPTIEGPPSALIQGPPSALDDAIARPSTSDATVGPPADRSSDGGPAPEDAPPSARAHASVDASSVADPSSDDGSTASAETSQGDGGEPSTDDSADPEPETSGAPTPPSIPTFGIAADATVISPAAPIIPPAATVVSPLTPAPALEASTPPEASVLPSSPAPFEAAPPDETVLPTPPAASDPPASTPPASPSSAPVADSDDDDLHDLETIPPNGALMAPLLGLGPAPEALVPTDPIRKRSAPVTLKVRDPEAEDPVPSSPSEPVPPSGADPSPPDAGADPAFVAGDVDAPTLTMQSPIRPAVELPKFVVPKTNSSRPSVGKAISGESRPLPTADIEPVAAPLSDTTDMTLQNPAIPPRAIESGRPAPALSRPAASERPAGSTRPVSNPGQSSLQSGKRAPESGRVRPVVRHQVRRDNKISVPVAPATRRTARATRHNDSIMGPSDRGFPWGWLVVVGMVAAAAYYLLFT